MDKNPQKIKEMFNNIAKSYDKNNNIISFGLHKKIKKRVIENFKFTGKTLDLCTGTGDIAGLLNKTSNVIGLDFSAEMLKIARKKYPNIEFIEGDCTNLPFDNNYFDNVTISFGLRNIENYDKALEEIHRVLKTGGKFLHLDFGKNNIFADLIYDFIIPILIKIFYRHNIPYKYLIQSKKEFFDQELLTTIFNKHNLKVIKTQNYLFGTISCQLCEKIL